MRNEKPIDVRLQNCFWCGESKGVVIMNNKKHKNNEYPMGSIVTDYEPCEKCAEIFKTGIQLIGVSDFPQMPNQPPIGKRDEDTLVYPTGAYCVVTENWVTNVIDDKALAESILKCRKSLLDDNIIQQMIKIEEKM